MGKKSGKKGPDPIEIPKDLALSLAETGWKNTWIAAHFRVHVDTLTKHIPPEELDAARLRGGGKLMQRAHQIAMGGRIEKKNPDGTITVSFVQGNMDMLKYMLDRRYGKATQVLEVNPDEDRPANVKVTLDDVKIKAAVESFESDY